MQLWTYIKDDEITRDFFLSQRSERDCKYYLSVAHLEELFYNEKKAPKEKMGTVQELKDLMRSYAEPDVISPKYEDRGLTLDSFINAETRVRTCDTTEPVKDLSKLCFECYKKNGIDPANLFHGIKESEKDAYKKVWEIEIVKNLSYALLDKRITCYDKLKNNYLDLEYVISTLFGILSTAGFKREKTEKKNVSGQYDIQHAICSTFCDMLITSDQRFADKYKAVAYKMQIPIDIKVYDYKNKVFKSEENVY